MKNSNSKLLNITREKKEQNANKMFYLLKDINALQNRQQKYLNDVFINLRLLVSRQLDEQHDVTSS